MGFCILYSCGADSVRCIGTAGGEEAECVNTAGSAGYPASICLMSAGSGAVNSIFSPFPILFSTDNAGRHIT